MSPPRKASTRAGTSARTARKPAARKSQANKSGAKKTPRKAASKKTGAPKSPARGSSKKTVKKSATKKTPATSKKKTSAKKTAGGKAATTRKKTTSARRKTVARGGPSAPRPSARAGASPKTPARRVRPAKFDKAQLAAIRNKLDGQRGDLERQLAEIEAASSDSTRSDRVGEIGADSDFADAGSATFERERELSIQNNMRDLIDQIGRAVDRIDDGLYGICERCGRPIDAARLRALPHALLCMDCKRREERAR